MACDATARLYDVDEDSVVFKRLDKTTKYDPHSSLLMESQDEGPTPAN